MSYRFGRCALDPATRQLLCDGAEVHLSPKAFELLLTLIENRPTALSKSDLLERLWPSTFVEETNLAGLVTEIRRATGDSATQPVFLRTVHRFGYRFIGDVDEIDVRGPQAPPPSRSCLLHENRETVLLEGINVLGRAPDATVRIEAPGVSRYHARVCVSNAEVTLEDLGSKNGTYLQRERITSARLTDGDEIRLGTARLTFRLKPPLEPTETVKSDVLQR